MTMPEPDSLIKERERSEIIARLKEVRVDSDEGLIDPKYTQAGFKGGIRLAIKVIRERTMECKELGGSGP